MPMRASVSVTFALIALIPASTVTMAQSMSEFEQWKKQYMGEFKQFKDEMDREFADFLKQRWKAFDSEKGVVRDEKPKPPSIPVARIPDKKPPPVPRDKPKPDIKKPPVTKPEPVVEIPRVKPAPPTPVVIPPPPVIKPEVGEKLIRVRFLGYDLSIVDGISKSIGRSGGSVNFNRIQQKFTDLAQSEYPATVENLQKIRRELKLNDWAYVQLVHEFSKGINTTDNNRKLVSWFILLKSGLDARVAYDANQIFLMVAVKQKLYDIAYIQYGEQKYYSVSRLKNLPLQLYSYDGQYPKKLDISDFSLAGGINSKPQKQFKTFKFRYRNKSYQLKLPYNRNTVDFLATYPQMDIDQYFQVPLDSATAQSLLEQLRPVVNGMSESEAVNLLLSFVQNAFRYKTDQEQFGEENYMFMEETIYYPASDCEDRSIFFAWLVRNLLDIDVIGLDFPGHIATAVNLKKPVGQVISYQGKRFSIADPTYINARAGMKMPQFKNVTPGVIPVL